MFIFDGERAGRLRRELAVLLNRDVHQQEVADELSRRLAERGNKRKVSDQVVRRLERGRVQRLDMEIINELAAFYRGYGLDVSTLVRYVEDHEAAASAEDGEKNVAPRYAAA